MLSSLQRPRRRKLANQILASQLAILAATGLVGFALYAGAQSRALDTQYEQRALSLAETIAAVPDLSEAMAAGDPQRTVARMAEHLRRAAGASYVVVIDLNRIRHSHPVESLIGRPVEEPILIATDGKGHERIDNGTTGRSANGIAPLYGPSGQLIGEVSVGIPAKVVSFTLWQNLKDFALWLGVALGGGALVSYGLAARLKRRTFGLELDEIATMLQEREATLHGIKEGMIAFDRTGRITLVNDEARRLVGIGGAAAGRRPADLLPPGRLLDVVSGALEGSDQTVLTDEHCLVVNRMPVQLGGRSAGWVITLRDRTELAALLRDLDAATSLTDALRAQHHEFANRMHVVAGLLDLGDSEEALRYINNIVGTDADFAESVRARIANSRIVGLILGKATVAAERGIEFDIAEESLLGDVGDERRERAVTSILGNLIDNAFDAVVVVATPRVVITVQEDEVDLTIRVADNGPGVPADAKERIFTDGYSTKLAQGAMHRGLGLAVVHRLVHRHGGEIWVADGERRGAEFNVVLPIGATIAVSSR